MNQEIKTKKMVFELASTNSLGNHFVAELRDINIQTDRMKFRHNLERLGSLLAYEISKKLDYESTSVQTPLGWADTDLISNQPVLISVLRASLPFYQGFLNFFDKADSGFLGAYRHGESFGLDFVINMDYLATPSLEGRDLILADTMLATGRSVIRSVEGLIKNGKPRHIYIASVIASKQGIQYVEENMELPFSIWTAAIDNELDDHGYIIPGLGDAGDLSYGDKI